MRFLFLIILALTFPQFAAAENVYEVKNVTVTQQGADQAKVREEAMEAAQRKAFEELQDRLVALNHITKKIEVSPKRIVGAVDAIDVVSEKSTAKAYKASFNVIFSAAEISRIFSIGYIEPTKEIEKFLVVPILVEGADVKIWKHEWWKTWNAEKPANITLPLGDLQDLQNLKKEDIAANKYDGLLRVQKRYNSNVSVLVQAQYLAAKNALDVQLEKIKGDDKIVINYEYPGGADITKAELLEAAANDISYRLENDKLTDESLSTSPNATPAAAPAPAAAPSLRAGQQPVVPTVPAAAPVEQLPDPVPHASTLPAVAAPVATRAAPAASIPQTPAANPNNLPEPYSPHAPGTGFVGDKRAAAAVNPAAPVATAPIIGQSTKTDVFVNAPDLMAWNRIRNKIVKTRGVSELQIKSFTAGRAYITIGHSGDISSIQSGLGAQGLDLSGDGTNWEIRER